MLRGESWQDAVIAAGLLLSRSGAYRLTQRVCVRGEEALEDHRHGHVSKMRPHVVAWLEETCRAAPQMPTRVVQAALHERFGVRVSLSHLNRVRAARGLSRPVGGGKGGPGGDR
jgi:transposase